MAWEFARENPTLDLATSKQCRLYDECVTFIIPPFFKVNPPFIYGPVNPQFPPAMPDNLGVNRMVYSLISGESGRPLPIQLPPFYCDVRDVARAHVKALTLDPLETPEKKRFIVSGGHFTWKEAVEYLEKNRPDLKSRLPPVTGSSSGLPGKLSSIDLTRARDVLKIEEYIPWESTIDDTISSLLTAEKKWVQS